MLHRDSFRPSELIVIKRAPASMLMPLGTLVRLNSGGPVGAVTGLDERDHVRVSWLTTPPLHSRLPEVCVTPASIASDARPTSGAAQRS